MSGRRGVEQQREPATADLPPPEEVDAAIAELVATRRPAIERALLQVLAGGQRGSVSREAHGWARRAAYQLVEREVSELHRKLRSRP